MADPRLNSVHLDPPRRADYRRARDELLRARGSQTLAVEADPDERGGNPHTLIQSPDQAPPGLDYWLVDNEYIYPLKTGINTVGRSPDNDVVVQDSYISRRHCAILVHAGTGCELHDTASKNGTYVNGQRIGGPTHLRSGDEIRICDQRLVFVSRGHPPERQATTHTLAG
ncbi:MAG TPA: FHA domain-containing protein [Gemmataceae bacterium]|nr:FHA domain-containing protein [Gemmataceae bacterium]